MKRTIKDLELYFLQKVAAKEPRAYEFFYYYCKQYFESNYKTVVFDISSKDDLFHEAFIVLWTEIETGKIKLEDNKICRMQKDRTFMPMTSSLITYLMSIIRNKSHENERKKMNTVPLNGDADFMEVYQEEDSSLYFGDETRMQIINKHLSNLGETSKRILTKFFLENKKLDKMFEEMKDVYANKNSLKTAKSNCLRDLKKNIKEDLERIKNKHRKENEKRSSR